MLMVVCGLLAVCIVFSAMGNATVGCSSTFESNLERTQRGPRHFRSLFTNPVFSRQGPTQQDQRPSLTDEMGKYLDVSSLEFPPVASPRISQAKHEKRKTVEETHDNIPRRKKKQSTRRFVKGKQKDAKHQKEKKDKDTKKDAKEDKNEGKIQKVKKDDKKIKANKDEKPQQEATQKDTKDQKEKKNEKDAKKDPKEDKKEGKIQKVKKDDKKAEVHKDAKPQQEATKKKGDQQVDNKGKSSEDKAKDEKNDKKGKVHKNEKLQKEGNEDQNGADAKKKLLGDKTRTGGSKGKQGAEQSPTQSGEPTTDDAIAKKKGKVIEKKSKNVGWAPTTSPDMAQQHSSGSPTTTKTAPSPLLTSTSPTAQSPSPNVEEASTTYHPTFFRVVKPSTHTGSPTVIHITWLPTLFERDPIPTHPGTASTTSSSTRSPITDLGFPTGSPTESPMKAPKTMFPSKSLFVEPLTQSPTSSMTEELSTSNPRSPSPTPSHSENQKSQAPTDSATGSPTIVSTTVPLSEFPSLETSISQFPTVVGSAEASTPGTRSFFPTSATSPLTDSTAIPINTLPAVKKRTNMPSEIPTGAPSLPSTLTHTPPAPNTITTLASIQPETSAPSTSTLSTSIPSVSPVAREGTIPSNGTFTGPNGTPSPMTLNPTDASQTDLDSFSVGVSVAVVVQGVGTTALAIGRINSSFPHRPHREAFDRTEDAVVQTLEYVIKRIVGYNVCSVDNMRRRRHKMQKRRHLPLQTPRSGDAKGKQDPKYPIRRPSIARYLTREATVRRNLVTLRHDPSKSSSRIGSTIRIDDGKRMLVWISLSVTYMIESCSTLEKALVSCGSKHNCEEIRTRKDEAVLSGEFIASTVREQVSKKIADGTLLSLLQLLDVRIVGVAEIGNETPIFLDLLNGVTTSQTGYKPLNPRPFCPLRVIGCALFSITLVVTIVLFKKGYERKLQRKAQRWLAALGTEADVIDFLSRADSISTTNPLYDINGSKDGERVMFGVTQNFGDEHSFC